MAAPAMTEGGDAPQVSIVVPVYRTGELAVRAVRSALEQSGVQAEVIAVDDGSDDDTVTLLRRIDDPRLRLVEQPINQGVAAARNRAIDLARGEWIALLDSDDWFAPGRCSALLDAAVATKADLIADDLWLVPNGSNVPQGRLFDGRLATMRTFDAVALVRAGTRGDATFLTIGLTKPLIRRNFLERHGLRYDQGLSAHEDLHLYVRCLQAGGRFVALPDAHYFQTCDRPGALTVGRRVLNARQAIAANTSLLTAAAHDGALRRALIARARTLEDNEAIQRVREPFLAGRLADACRAAIATPRVIPAGLRRIAQELKGLQTMPSA